MKNRYLLCSALALSIASTGCVRNGWEIGVPLIVGAAGGTLAGAAAEAVSISNNNPSNPTTIPIATGIGVLAGAIIGTIIYASSPPAHEPTINYTPANFSSVEASPEVKVQCGGGYTCPHNSKCINGFGPEAKCEAIVTGNIVAGPTTTCSDKCVIWAVSCKQVCKDNGAKPNCEYSCNKVYNECNVNCLPNNVQ
jgi:hypothetical protein